MLDMDDKKTLISIIDNRKPDELIVPIYVRVGNTKYSLMDLEQIPDYTPGTIFHVGFGTSYSIFIKNYFPHKRMLQFFNVDTFKIYDESNQCDIFYYTFESDYTEKEDKYTEIMNQWYTMLLDRIKEYVKINRERRRKHAMESINN